MYFDWWCSKSATLKLEKFFWLEKLTKIGSLVMRPTIWTAEYMPMGKISKTIIRFFNLCNFQLSGKR